MIGIYLKNIYEISKNKCKPFQKKFVFLNAWFSQEDMYNEQLSYINCLKEICSNTYSVKLHPHEKDTDISEKYYIEDCGNFEIANILYDSTNKIYISIISTACLTPKWLADSKPIIIYLFDIFLGKFEIPEWKETKKVISKFIEKENYQNRIFIPRTMEEYRKILNDLNKEVV